MAKEARRLEQKAVLDWFSGLSFDAQQSVLDRFSETFEGSKRKRIEALERELRALRGREAARPEASKAPKRADKASPKKGMTIPPKYRHPTTGQTWAGRGVYPKWIEEYLKKRGTKLDDLLIKK